MTKAFYSNGKLLITGEYAVLDGALSLALPTKYGQSLTVKKVASNQLRWTSFDEKGNIWFEETFDLSSSSHIRKEQSPSPLYIHNLKNKSRENKIVVETLLKILREANTLNPNFLGNLEGCHVETKLTFPRDWGLGSSSTLINNIAQWAEVDAYQLLWNAFSGSGYDIACAQNDHPVLYGLVDGKPKVAEVDFDPMFQDQLYFVYLNKKQNSRDGIASYQKKDFNKVKLVERISEITRKTVSCKSLSELELLMNRHEQLISQTLAMQTVKTSLFPDFKGIVKSLGAWGGDFIMVSGDEKTPSYFRSMGFKTVLSFADMVLKS